MMPDDFGCEQNGRPSPQPQCRCRNCYRMRMTSVDPRLLSILNEDRFNISLPSKSILHTRLQAYAAGQIEWASLHFEIIKGLMDLNDKLWDDLRNAAMTRPMFVEIQQKDNAQ
jgi:hypothetical protein